jgi:hypothetical protein
MSLWTCKQGGDYRLCVQVVCSEMRRYSQEIGDGTDKYWAEVTSEKPHLFDGPVWSLVSWSIVNQMLHINLQPSSYKYVLYTHFSQATASIPKEARANSLGSSAITVTSDGKVVIGLRSKSLGMVPDTWHMVPAGNVDTPDLVAHIKTELKEELSIDLKDSDTVTVYGLFDAGSEQGHKTEIVFLIQLNSMSFEDVLCRYQTVSEIHNEHVELMGVTCCPAELRLTQLARSVLESYFT